MGGPVRTTDLADGSSVLKKWQLAWPTPTPKPGCPGSKVDGIAYGWGPDGLWVRIKRPK